MNAKLLLIKEIYSSKHILAISGEEKRIYNVLIFSYIKACVLKNPEHFTLSFNGKYIRNCRERMIDWFHYCIEKCYEVYYKTFKPNDDKTIRKYNLIHFGATKPIHIKISNCPNERILEEILTRHGFEIIDEHISTIITEYEVVKSDITAQRSAINGIKKMSNKNLMS